MKKILVVDDDLQQRDLYAELFKSAGYDIVLAADGAEAFDLTEKQKPNLIFSGIMMPLMDGFTLAQKIRSAPNISETPLVLFSHLGREEDRKKASEIRGVSFMVKGYDSPAEILKKIKIILGDQR